MMKKGMRALLCCWSLLLPLCAVADVPSFADIRNGFHSSYAELHDRNGVLLGREIPVGTTPAVSFANPERFGSILMGRQRRHDWGGLSSGSVNYDITADLDLGPTTHRAFVYSGLETADRTANRLLWDYSAFDFLKPVYEPNPATRSTNGRQTIAEKRTNRT